MKNRIFFIIILFSLWLLTSCGAAAPAAEAPEIEEPAAEEPAAPAESLPETIDKLYILESAVWDSSNIHVCWENPSTENRTERELIQTAIENTWEAVSQVDFVGWETCDHEATGIRIQISDESPHPKGLGKNIDGLQNGMVLNITFERWGCVDTESNLTPCTFPYNNYLKEDLIRITAVHEFGHALGFAHEQNRADAPSWCDSPQGENGTMPIGGWDQHSVMNYCNSEWLGSGYLSEMDRMGVQTIYGMKITEKEHRKSGIQIDD